MKSGSTDLEQKNREKLTLQLLSLREVHEKKKKEKVCREYKPRRYYSFSTGNSRSNTFSLHSPALLSLFWISIHSILRYYFYFTVVKRVSHLGTNSNSVLNNAPRINQILLATRADSKWRPARVYQDLALGLVKSEVRGVWARAYGIINGGFCRGVSYIRPGQARRHPSDDGSIGIVRRREGEGRIEGPSGPSRTITDKCRYLGGETFRLTRLRSYSPFRSQPCFPAISGFWCRESLITALRFWPCARSTDTVYPSNNGHSVKFGIKRECHSLFLALARSLTASLALAEIEM